MVLDEESSENRDVLAKEYPEADEQDEQQTENRAALEALAAALLGDQEPAPATDVDDDDDGDDDDEGHRDESESEDEGGGGGEGEGEGEGGSEGGGEGRGESGGDHGADSELDEHEGPGQGEGEPARGDTHADAGVEPPVAAACSLSAEDEYQFLLYEWFSQHHIGDEAYDALRGILNYATSQVQAGNLNSVSIPSKAVLQSAMTRLSGLQEQRFDICPKGCVCYADPRFAQMDTCPSCNTGRYRPLTASERRKQAREQKKNRDAPPILKPRRTTTVFPHEPLVAALNINVASATAAVDFNQRTSAAMEQGKTTVSDIAEGFVARRLRENDEHLPPDCRLVPNNHTIHLIHSSDGAEIHDKRNPDETVKAAFTVTLVQTLPPALRSLKYAWRYSVAGDFSIGDPQSFTYPYEADAARLEAPAPRFNAVTGRVTPTNAVILAKAADTIEVRDQMRTGASGSKESCFWCRRVGCRNTGAGYSIPFLACEDDPTVGDVALEGVDGLQEKKELQIRDYATTRTIYRVLESDLLTDAQARYLRRESGIQGRPSFSTLTAMRGLYPYWWTLDPMHLRYRNDFPLSIRLLFGKQPSAQPTPLISETDQRTIDILHLSSRSHKPTQVSGAVRSIASKFGDFKAWEIKSLVTQDLRYLTMHLDLHPAAHRLILLMTKISQLLHRKVIETAETDQAKPNEFDLTFIPDDGRLVVPLVVLRGLVHEYLHLRERIFYQRQRRYMKGITTPSAHRPVHEEDSLRFYGPSGAISQDILETIIGLDKRFIGSRRKPVENLTSIQRRCNTVILMRLRFCLPELAVASKSNRATHPGLPGLALLHPRTLKPQLPLDVVVLLDNWLLRRGLRREAARRVVRWDRLELRSGDVVRSRRREQAPPLATRGSWRSDEMPAAESAAAADSESTDEADLQAKTRRSARFVKLSVAGRICHGEVQDFYAVPIAGAPDRLVAHVSIFTRSRIVDGVSILIDRAAPRLDLVVGIEDIRGSVGLTQMAKHEDGREWLGVSMKAGRDPEPLVELR